MKPPIKNCKWIMFPLGDIVQHYGENPELYKKIDLAFHNGIDLVRPHGEHLYAVEDGVVCA
jgi:murein DD-endopeptidase MepM/ murein hydrolase activator NlpD